MKRSIRIVFGWAMALFLVMGSAGCCRAMLPLALSPTAAQAHIRPQVSVQRIKVSDIYVKIDLAYPVLAGLADRAFQADLNMSILADMNAQVSQLELSAKACYQSAAAGLRPFYRFSLTSAVEIHRNDSVILSFSSRMENYTGGAHGNMDSRFYNILNTSPARQLSLCSLFTMPIAGISRVDGYIKDDIAAQQEYFFPEPAISVGHSTWFYVTETKLHVVYPTYSIAPYVTGEPDFSIPLSSLADILIPDFFP